MRQSHPDVQDHRDESELKTKREQERRKAQREMLEPPFVYHEVVTEEDEGELKTVLAGTWDIRQIEDPKLIGTIVSELPFVPDSEFDMKDIDDVDKGYENKSDLDMSTDILAEFLKLGGNYE